MLCNKKCNFQFLFFLIIYMLCNQKDKKKRENIVRTPQDDTISTNSSFMLSSRCGVLKIAFTWDGLTLPKVIST